VENGRLTLDRIGRRDGADQHRPIRIAVSAATGAARQGSRRALARPRGLLTNMKRQPFAAFQISSG